MNDHKPEWYARLKKGPFEEKVFDSKMEQRVRERTVSGWEKTPKRRMSPWTLGGMAAAFLIFVFVVVPLLAHQFSPYLKEDNNGTAAIAEKYVVEHLKLGMSQEEVRQSFGLDYIGQSVRRDFSREHVEDPNNLNTWSAVDLWRYDYGVKDGYRVNAGPSDVHEAIGFDLPGLENGNIESQLVVVWKDGVVYQAYYKYKDDEGLHTFALKPPHTPQQVEPEKGPRAIGVSLDSSGVFTLIPKPDTEEKSAPLGAPSCLGQEDDLNITGAYSLFYQLPKAGESRLIQEWDHLELILKSGQERIEMIRIDFPGVEMFLLLPRYTDCHGLEFYAYGIDKKSGEAFPFTFQNGQGFQPYWTTSPVNLPHAKDGKLIVEGGRGAGQDGATRYVYVPDVQQGQLLLESKEQIP